MSQTIRKGDGVEDMPRVIEIIWRAGPASREPYQIKVVQRNPKSTDILYTMRGNDGRVISWEVWRQYPREPGLDDLEFKTKRSAWEYIIRRRERDLLNAEVQVVHARHDLRRAREAMEEDKEVI